MLVWGVSAVYIAELQLQSLKTLHDERFLFVDKLLQEQLKNLCNIIMAAVFVHMWSPQNVCMS